MLKCNQFQLPSSGTFECRRKDAHRGFSPSTPLSRLPRRPAPPQIRGKPINIEPRFPGRSHTIFGIFQAFTKLRRHQHEPVKQPTHEGKRAKETFDLPEWTQFLDITPHALARTSFLHCHQSLHCDPAQFPVFPAAWSVSGSCQDGNAILLFGANRTSRT
ncbi:hypothetical protein BJ508DRAFT_130699 [Ascobolus immersus RN42]|uniref:Uncharacterized protein n=1 Tax=Ascobolus immersus RN42 TaxID=1160509 RepID=A0A3N4I7S7_ASCIM|nr:hypothetical protein BJ508DRAFT_130699 [Ascobolus immersus RN42]